MIILTILTVLAGVILANFAWIGIGHYKQFSEDEDKVKTAFVLRFFISIVLLVLLACNAIMVFTDTTKDNTNNHVLESAEKK